jgi:hypothetical protein
VARERQCGVLGVGEADGGKGSFVGRTDGAGERGTHEGLESVKP